MNVATLARVVFEHPDQGALMLALERLAALREKEGGHCVTVKTQPFGGAVRLRSLSALFDRVNLINGADQLFL